MNVAFIELAEALDIHRDLLERYGREPGLVDLELLTSALAAPAAGLGEKYAHQGPWEMAAACLYYLINLHPFISCNLRVAVVAALVFLELNGYELAGSQEDIERLVREIDRGKAGKSEAAEFFRRRVVKKIFNNL